MRGCPPRRPGSAETSLCRAVANAMSPMCGAPSESAATPPTVVSTGCPRLERIGEVRTQASARPAAPAPTRRGRWPARHTARRRRSRRRPARRRTPAPRSRAPSSRRPTTVSNVSKGWSSGHALGRGERAARVERILHEAVDEMHPRAVLLDPRDLGRRGVARHEDVRGHAGALRRPRHRGRMVAARGRAHSRTSRRGTDSTEFSAPRALKDPVCWRNSSLSTTLPASPLSSAASVRTGVRRIRDPLRNAAASMSGRLGTMVVMLMTLPQSDGNRAWRQRMTFGAQC